MGWKCVLLFVMSMSRTSVALVVEIRVRGGAMLVPCSISDVATICFGRTL